MNPAFDPSKTRFQVLKVVVDHEEEHSEGISLDEIAEILSLSGRPAVHYHIAPLLEEGFIKKAKTAHRYLRSTKRGRALVKIIIEGDSGAEDQG